MKKLFFLFFLFSCSPISQDISPVKKKLDFDNNLSFDDFNKLLKEHVKTNPYPNIDK
tara:strand:- start:323 stop:493 length:171 start_codon:yes stop_codon:yes gene_type:complete